MAVTISNVLEILAHYKIWPPGEYKGGRLLGEEDIDLPGIGHIEEGESVYPTSIAEIFGRDDDTSVGGPFQHVDDPRLREWWEQVEIIRSQKSRAISEAQPNPVPVEPLCAWYSPIHFYGRGWGIYIRENCILSVAIAIARFVQWPNVRASQWDIARQLLRSAFYVFFLHEQFHHKVESLGFRLLIATGTDRYRPYKDQVYRRTFGTTQCLEESLANAESYRRLDEERYVKRVDPAIRKGLKGYLKASIQMQPPGYREGVRFLTEVRYRDGLFDLQSQLLHARTPPITPPDHWSVAPNMITALADIADNIYLILLHGARPILVPGNIDPGATVSSRALEGALTRHQGYQRIPGGKGSHVKLAKPGAPTIIIPGNKPVLSPGVVRHALDAIGYPMSKLPDLLSGKLAEGIVAGVLV